MDRHRFASPKLTGLGRNRGRYGRTRQHLVDVVLATEPAPTRELETTLSSEFHLFAAAPATFSSIALADLGYLAQPDS